MKEFIYINYNLKIEKIYKNSFFINDEKIKIVKFNSKDKINTLVELSNELYKNGIPVNTFIINREGEYYTKRNKEYISLLKINDRDNYLDINYLNRFNVENKLEKENIYEEYKHIIDEFEDKITKYNKEYTLIQKTANYYIGMAENAISLLNDNKNTNDNNISHKINIYNFNKEEINNPLNFSKIDFTYNITNYIKYKFINNILDYNELYEIIKLIKTEQYEELFFSHMLFPNYYFDLINDQIEEEKIEKIIKLIPKYEKLLQFIKENLKKSKKIKLFVWLN